MDNKNNVVLDRGNGTTCTVNLHGATIISWKYKNEEQLFVSRCAIFDNRHPIRGGIPIVFPQFGPWHIGPQHGFARILPWAIQKNPRKMDNGDVEAVFSLKDSGTSRAIWNFAFELTYRIILRENNLQTSISVFNPGPEKSFSFNLLFHTYINIPDIRKCGIAGLKKALYLDKTRRCSSKLQDSENILKIAERTNRIYQNTCKQHVVLNTAGGRNIIIHKLQLPDTVIWNPWKDQAIELFDFEDNEYLNMVCVEAGLVTKRCCLPPGISYGTSQILEIV